ncbi:MAG TPA: hypothetical protein VFB79_06275, partial [Candidatus Angelobacter sp.]|nr:hypothetical protein [Candidatus Angelobacter sp.]
TNELENLKAEDIQVRMSGRDLPVVDFTRKFSNRLLILVETDGAEKSDKLADVVEMVTRQARTAPEGKPVAFGIYSEKALFTKGFADDPEKRADEVNDVIEQASSLGKRVAMWDALHQAIALFGAHQPGDTILLVGEPYDDKSRHSAQDIEKEFLSTGTRLFIMRRQHPSRVERDFVWSSHSLEKTVLERITQETGGLLSEYVPSLIRFGWAGYLLQVKLPADMNRPRQWKVLFRGPAAKIHKKTNFYYPTLLRPCQLEQATVR